MLKLKGVYSSNKGRLLSLILGARGFCSFLYIINMECVFAIDIAAQRR